MGKLALQSRSAKPAMLLNHSDLWPTSNRAVFFLVGCCSYMDTITKRQTNTSGCWLLKSLRKCSQLTQHLGILFVMFTDYATLITMDAKFTVDIHQHQALPINCHTSPLPTAVVVKCHNQPTATCWLVRYKKGCC